MAKNLAILVLLLAVGYERYQVSTVNTSFEQTQAQLTTAKTEASNARAATVDIGQRCEARLTQMSDLLTKAQNDLQQTRTEVMQVSAEAASQAASQANAAAEEAKASNTHPLLSLVSRMVGR